MKELEVTSMTVNIKDAVNQHFKDINHNPEVHDVTYENCQARERTQVLMDIANQAGGIVVGTGDLSEVALGWSTYNGDHMSMYGVNVSVPKTLVRYLVDYVSTLYKGEVLEATLQDILHTPVSPELLPAKDGEITQKTEDIVGPYELHDFFLYHHARFHYEPQKLLRIAIHTYGDKYDEATIKNGSLYSIDVSLLSSSSVAVSQMDLKLVQWLYLLVEIYVCLVMQMYLCGLMSYVNLKLSTYVEGFFS